MTIKYFCCWLFLFCWYKNFMSTFVVGVGCLWYWWLKIFITQRLSQPVNRLYWRKENQKSIVRGSKWLSYLCLYEAPYDKKNSTHPLSFYISIMTHPLSYRRLNMTPPHDFSLPSPLFINNFWSFKCFEQSFFCFTQFGGSSHNHTDPLT